MLFRKKIFMTLAFAALAVPAFPQQSSRAQLAGLSEDVASLRAEVARLRIELDELRAENAHLFELAEKKIDPAETPEAKVASLRAEVKEMLAVQRREITAETDTKIKALADMTNRAMSDLSGSVNRAVAAAAVPAPVPKPTDFPSGGIEYTVKAGDTLGKIIARHGSRQDWILYANPGLDPDKIYVGQKLFVPQKD